MRCPFCQFQIHAGSPECPACHLTFPRTSALLGAVPRLSPKVADTTGSLKPAEQSKLKSRIMAIERRFPQLALQVVMHRFPEEHPLSLHVFWLFNAAAFAGEGNRGRDNHALLLAIDPTRSEAAIIPGYGLEPFLTNEAADQLLQLANPSWAANLWTDGILRMLDGLDQWLETTALPDESNPSAGDDF